MASPLAPPLLLYNLGGVPRRASMELCEACHVLPRRGRRGFDRCSYSGAIRTLLRPPFNSHLMQQKNDLKVNVQAGISYHLSGSKLMSRTDGDSIIACNGVRKVLWSIEADIADGYLLFLTGDPISLGCWEPEMAVHVSRCKGHANIWMSEIKVPCGIHFKYNYFIKDGRKPLRDIIWRLGPEFSLSIPTVGNEDEVIVVRDFWMSFRIQGPPVPTWGSWMLDVGLPYSQPKHGNSLALSAGEIDYMRNLNISSLIEEQLPVNWVPMDEGKLLDKDPVVNSEGSEENLSEQEQPIEEPWLLRSTYLSFSDSSELDDAISQEKQPKRLPEKLHEIGKTPSDYEHKIGQLEEHASTVILINSSLCTMQRIAVLEDNKLVELLLEPVKNNVQCDSIYLGVLTKLVPHMGGAFVDIGISRPSFMDIRRNREPFVYPPFHHVIERESPNNSKRLELKVSVDSHEHYQPSYDEDDMTDALLDLDHLDEHEVAVDLVTPSALKMSTSNDTTDFNGVETDFGETNEDQRDHIEDEYADDFLPLETESSNSGIPLLIRQSLKSSDDAHRKKSKWDHVREGTRIIVQVVKEGLGTKGPSLTAYPNLRSRFWILITRCERIGVSKKITGAERTRLKVIAKTLQPPGFGLTVRTVAAAHSLDELKKDLDGLISTWKSIVEHAKSAALAAEEGVEGAVPVMLHRAMGQTLSVVQDYFNEKVKSMVVDSPRTYHEVTSYLQEIALDLCNRVELYDKRIPIFDEYNIEEEINNILSKRVPLSNGGYLVIEQTEALVSIDVNGGQCMLGEGTSQEKAVLDVNLAAVKQIARELRLRDIGGIIVVDFIDMADESNRRLVYEDMKRLVERDRSTVRVSELSKLGLMEITRKRVRPSVTFMISEPCTCCHATGRVEALETSFSKIEHEICRLLALSDHKQDPENAKSWPRFVLRVDRHMCNYLTSGKRSKLAILSSTLKVWILLKVARGFPRGVFEVKPFADEKANEVQQVAISRLRPAEATAYISSPKLTLFPVKKWKSKGK